MTDLSDFGGGIDRPESSSTESTESSGSGYGRSYQYRRGRCRAVNTSTIVRRRCRSPCSGGNLCAAHLRESKGPGDRPVTIDSDPAELIRWQGRKAARCRALERSGERCDNACGVLEYFCGLHSGGDFETVDEPEDRELDVNRIREAIDAVQEASA